MQSIGNLVRDPDFSAYYAAHDFSRDVVLQGATASLPGPCAFRCSTCIRMATGAKLLLSRDVTALEQTDAMRRDFVANVKSHEIRNSPTVLIGFIEPLQDAVASAGANPPPGHDVAASPAHAKRGAGLAYAIPAGRWPCCRA